MRPARLRLARCALACALLACGTPPTTAPSPGTPCEGQGAACDAAATSLLQCTDGQWKTYSDCKGPDGCRERGDEVLCDTAGNGAGDRCAPSSEGKVRCQPDGGRDILRCVEGAFSVIYTCAEPTSCGFLGDGGLSCI